MTQITTVSAPVITNENFFFLKGRFKSGATNLYGLFLAVYNPQRIMESHNAVVSTFSNIYDLEPHNEWSSFEDKITEYRWKGNCNANTTNAIINVFETINKDARLRDELYSMITSYNYSQIEIMLFDHFHRLIRDKSTILETGIQEASPEEVVRVREQRAKKTHEEKDQKVAEHQAYAFEVEEGSTIIPMAIVLSPVRGKLLYELKIGDKIMLRFNPKTEIGKHYINIFSLGTPDGKIRAIPGEVIDIKSDSKSLPVNVLTKIDEHVYGVSVEEERHVRVCTYDPKVDGIYKNPSRQQQPVIQTARTSPASQSQTKYSSATYFLLGIVAFILMVLLMLLYIML